MCEAVQVLALMLAPFAPYLSQEIWEQLGNQGPVFRQSWPAFDPELAKEDLAEVVVQVNGKLRGRIHVPFGTPEEELVARAKADEKVKASLADCMIIREIVVPDKLVNIHCVNSEEAWRKMLPLLQEARTKYPEGKQSVEKLRKQANISKLAALDILRKHGANISLDTELAWLPEGFLE